MSVEGRAGLFVGKPGGMAQYASQARLVAAGLTPENVNTLYETTKAISDFLSDNEELCEAAFGDHVRVIVTPSGVEVEDYDHD